MRHATSAAVAVWVMVGATLATGCKGNDGAVGREAATRAAAHVVEGRGMIERLVTGLGPALTEAGAVLGPAMAAPVDAARVRNRLLDLNDDRNPAGRALSMYPTYFIAAVGPDGVAVAGNRAVAQDWTPGKNLGAAFPCVAAALQGTAGQCAAELPTVEGQPVRAYQVSVVPLRAEANGPVVGALLGAYSFGRLAKAVREALNVQTASERVQLHVGLWRGTRVLPSGQDNDVPQAFLVPDQLLGQLPGDTASRLGQGDGRFTHSFAENNGRMWWGVAGGPVPTLGQGVGLIVYRAPLRQ